MSKTFPSEDTRYAFEPRALFEVTCVIGTVFDSMDGQLTPREAAFNLIATHEAEGTFSFPNEDGSITHVTVVREPREELQSM